MAIRVFILNGVYFHSLHTDTHKIHFLIIDLPHPVYCNAICGEDVEFSNLTPKEKFSGASDHISLSLTTLTLPLFPLPASHILCFI